MANKNKKGKIIKLQPIPIKKYIIEHARKLPIKGCYTFGTTQGLTQIYVVREKRNGNVLVGFYLVDAYCLGLKNTFFTEFEDFDTFYAEISVRNRNEQLNKMDTCYAQNLIYGAIEYAEDAGFEPNKDFNITEYILDDVETLEFIDIEFGNNGKYTYWEGPNDNVKKVIATLDKNIGKGNYNFVAHFGGESDFNEDEEEEVFDEDEIDEVEEGKDFPEKYWAKIDQLEDLSEKQIEEIFLDQLHNINESVKGYYGLLRICSLGIYDLWDDDDDFQDNYFTSPKNIIEQSQKYFSDKFGTSPKLNFSISREMIITCLENQIHFNSPNYILLNDFVEAVTVYQESNPNDGFNQLVYDFMLPFGFKRTNFLILMLNKISKKLYKKASFDALSDAEYKIVSEKLFDILENNKEDEWPELKIELESYEDICVYLPIETDDDLKKRFILVREDLENSFV